MTEHINVSNKELAEPVFTTCWEVTGCSRSDYMACPAFQQRKNCYELERVVCCNKHRDNCATCPVYVAINKVPTQKVRVKVCTDRFDIVGTLHIPVGARLSDFVNRADKSFIVVTDAEVKPINESDVETRDSVAIVNKAHIVTAWPIEELADKAA